MTSATILPSIGPPPPEFRRPIVPEELLPNLVSEREEPRSREDPFAQPKSDTDQSTFNQTGTTVGVVVEGAARVRENQSQPASNTIGGTSAVVLQVREAEANSATLDVSEQEILGELTDEEKAIVEDLKERDREVRAHEAAHANVGRGYAGTPNFEYVRGPDGVQYAVGGHVQIDVAPVPNDPEATIEKMEVVRSAALAPARPSGQDRAVAAAAEAAMREAQAELNEQKKEELQQQRKPSETDAVISAAPYNTQLSNSVSSLTAAAEKNEQQPSDLFAAEPAGINLLV